MSVAQGHFVQIIKILIVLQFKNLRKFMLKPEEIRTLCINATSRRTFGRVKALVQKYNRTKPKKSNKARIIQACQRHLCVNYTFYAV